MKAVALLLLASALVLGIGGCDSPQSARPKKILVFTKSSNYEHSAIKRNGTNLSTGEEILRQMGETNNLEFTFTKDGRLFTPENIARFDAFVFYTTGELTEPGTDRNPPMSPEGKAAFLEAVKNGKGFVGIHSASDTFHSPGNLAAGAARYQEDGTNVSPYVQMLGGEFIQHGGQQKSHLICADPNFPGASAVPADFGPNEEWYTFKNFAPDLHAILVQDTSHMRKTAGYFMYDRPPYPSTWAHLYGKGRVFYTSMGHREDVWSNPVFQQVLLGGIEWAVHNVNADITPNLRKVAPDADQLPPYQRR